MRNYALAETLHVVQDCPVTVSENPTESQTPPPDHDVDECGSLRERKARLTRQALQDAALELVDEHSLEEVTVAQIAERAGVSTRTFFNYFPTKEDAIVSLSVQAMDSEARRRVVEAQPERENALAEVAYAMRAVFTAIGGEGHNDARMRRLLARYPQLVNRRMEITKDVEAELVELATERLAARGIEFDDPDGPMMALLICKSAMQHTYRTLYRDSGDAPSQDSSDESFAASVKLLPPVIERLS